MGDHSRRFKRAITVPTLKMRVFQESVFAVCLVAALGAVSAVIIARSTRARDRSNAASGAFAIPGAFYEGAGLIEKAQLLLREGKSAEATEVLREIVASVEDSARLMEGPGERFTQIGIIIDVMTDIADQTNLLALNAAIEAAHAGEHGKGFAVVAGEVCELAENSKRSAEQISRLIREIMSETNRVVASMAVGNERVEAGLAVAEKSGEVLEGIVDASRTGALAAGEISSAIKAIAANTDQVFASINDMASIARQTAASSQEVTATIRERKISTEDVARSSLGLAELAFQLSDLT